MATCAACPTFSSSDSGSEKCKCIAGMFWNSTQCQECTNSSVSQEGSMSCETCPAGYLPMERGTQCNCPEGMIWKWNETHHGSCEPCPPGTYKNEKMSSCTVCPEGTTSLAKSHYCQCNAGMYWNQSSCYSCPSGSVSPPGSQECQLCHQGASADPGRSSCSCPIWRSWSWSEEGVGSCLSIPKDLLLVPVLACTTGLLMVVSTALGLLFCWERKKGKKDDKGLGRVAYNTSGVRLGEEEGNSPSAHADDIDSRCQSFTARRGPEVNLTDLAVARSIIGCAARPSSASRYNK